jgi:TatD DNase family protein
MLVDSHCHLDFPDFADDLAAVVSRAEQSGVGVMVSIGTHLSRFSGVLAVADRYPSVYCTAGIHPHEAGSAPPASEDALRTLALHPKVIGFGETGLDFYYDKSPRSEQEASFRTHIAAARAAGLPVVIHSRDADRDMARILAEEMDRGRFAGLLHCFSSGADLARTALDLGLYISVSGIITFKNSSPLRDIVADIPLDRLLVETDCPYLAPSPHRGRRNEPAFVRHTADALAAIKGVSAAEVAEATTANFLRLFTKVPR